MAIFRFFAWFICLLIFSTVGYAQIDKKATKETKAVYRNLKRYSKDKILFGHHDATLYGHGWSGEEDRSDVKSVVGSHPAVVGVDFMGLSGKSEESIAKEKIRLRRDIKATYDRGGLTTVSWHLSNPASAGDFYWKDSVSVAAMQLVKPGGSHHEKYKEILKTIGNFAKTVKGKDGTLAPMIFRPFHEFDGDWFWWGKKHTSGQDFIDVWRFTVTYLRDSLEVHNFIYAFSPDCKFNSEAEFTERYPGNDFVDMVGMDDYADFGRDGKYNLEAGVKKLKIVSDFAQKNDKLAAFTETGLETIPNATWWTGTLLKTLKTADIHLAYVMVWRNDAKSPTHYYAPFPGQQSVPDFKTFYEDSFTVFEKDLKGLYK